MININLTEDEVNWLINCLCEISENEYFDTANANNYNLFQQKMPIREHDDLIDKLETLVEKEQ